ncbi:TPA: hypothetical protein N0F65_012669 [Lagenidium giganteum]|uniref:BRCT domain-containing protein n=1 Tax=Lagenidium giganteum TaxID=4803 RepID=A0AAV2YML9_9STRA|nr:TPA: hypothetical protein N0F65_012669 [Lagenidium giganteum]
MARGRASGLSSSSSSEQDNDKDSTYSESDHDSDNAALLFQGHQFYISRALRPNRRLELLRLIPKYGGTVVPHIRPDAVELVDDDKLEPAKDWVAASFVFDSVAAMQLKDVTRYMYQVPLPERKRARRTRKPYTVEEDAKMLKFVKENAPYWTTKMSIPEAFWYGAAEKKLTDHPPQSMHEHFRKKLRLLTKLEQERLLQHAEREQQNTSTTDAPPTTAQRDPEVPSTPQQPRERAGSPSTDKKSSSAETASPGNATATEQAPKAATRTPSKTPPPHNRRVSPAHAKPQTNSGNTTTTDSARTPGTQRRLGDDDEEQKEEAEPEDVRTPQPKALRRSTRSTSASKQPLRTEPADNGSKDPQKDGASTRSQPSATRQHRTPPPSSAKQRSRALTVDDDEEEQKENDQTDERKTQRVSKRGAPAPDGDETEEEQRDEARTTPRAIKRTRSTPNANPSSKQRQRSNSATQTPPAPPQQAGSVGVVFDSHWVHRLAQLASNDEVRQYFEHQQAREDENLEDVEVQGIPIMSETESEQAIARLQFASSQDPDAVIHALFYSSGDVDVAAAFFRGEMPVGMWSAEEDRLLQPFLKSSLEELRLAQRRGAFDGLRTPRPFTQVVRRVQFLQ